MVMSPGRRVLYLLLPLAIALALLWIPIQTAIEESTQAPESLTATIPEGHHWIAFAFEEDEVYPSDGAMITIHAEEELNATGEVNAENRVILFDLDEVENLEDATVVWPDGREQRFSNPAVDELHFLDYPSSINVAMSNQWAVRGSFYRFWGWLAAGALLLLLTLRIFNWAESEREGQHAG